MQDLHVKKEKKGKKRREKYSVFSIFVFYNTLFLLSLDVSSKIN